MGPKFSCTVVLAYSNIIQLPMYYNILFISNILWTKLDNYLINSKKCGNSKNAAVKMFLAQLCTETW